MDTSAELTADEIVGLRDAQSTFEQSAKRFEDLRQRAGIAFSGVFEESLRLKNTLDHYEATARFDPKWTHLSVLLNCEYQLYTLNRGTPLRYNPFLSHWVEALQRLSQPPSEHETLFKIDGPVPATDMRAVRIEMIKSLLRADDPSQFSRFSPKVLYDSVVEQKKNSPFEIEPYIRMLEEEGIYERTASSPVAQGKLKQAVDSSNSQPLNDRQQWSQYMLSRMEMDPKSAVDELTHLPVELAYLDFLTTLVQNQTLQKLDIPASPVIRDYIQHALRLAEHMGEHPRATPASVPESSNSAVNGGAEDGEHGRAAQTRTIKLLLLFLRNLIRKALIPPEDIYFEIQEICVRYVWIREVREFRAFIEEGEDGEEG
ncbi:hypothetical protein BCR34DRAFT_481547 [Clohesyomyces aquaticus]|uniref:Uncharacterized protein n=1 Tax=Clohesyomyces aquaticus TaxID=1231657 RepID=A0A1Y1ZSH1_9PLEO|nr:hypothetical protein BCR34DRAFT_481547 [Clohesyomyces aquaticus]